MLCEPFLLSGADMTISAALQQIRFAPELEMQANALLKLHFVETLGCPEEGEEKSAEWHDRAWAQLHEGVLAAAELQAARQAEAEGEDASAAAAAKREAGRVLGSLHRR